MEEWSAKSSPSPARSSSPAPKAGQSQPSTQEGEEPDEGISESETDIVAGAQTSDRLTDECDSAGPVRSSALHGGGPSPEAVHECISKAIHKQYLRDSAPLDHEHSQASSGSELTTDSTVVMEDDDIIVSPSKSTPSANVSENASPSTSPTPHEGAGQRAEPEGREDWDLEDTGTQGDREEEEEARFFQADLNDRTRGNVCLFILYVCS